MVTLTLIYLIHDTVSIRDVEQLISKISLDDYFFFGNRQTSSKFLQNQFYKSIGLYFDVLGVVNVKHRLLNFAEKTIDPDLFLVYICFLLLNLVHVVLLLINVLNHLLDIFVLDDILHKNDLPNIDLQLSRNCI